MAKADASEAERGRQSFTKRQRRREELTALGKRMLAATASMPMDQKLRGNLSPQTFFGKCMSALPITLRGAKLNHAHSVFIACFRKGFVRRVPIR
ncbi:hypothetical protein [Mesorhizobium sp. M0203]|uniref:hypothetical protein n=1 Tax=Mesorhizobium sp. M0203 TaxID=2956912 RepID=UPI003338AA80